MALHSPTLATRPTPASTADRARAGVDASAAAYLTTLSRFTGRDPDRICYVPGAAELTRRDPVGSVVLAFCSEPDPATVLAHVAAARAAGNTVGIILTGPVTSAITDVCSGIERTAGTGLARRLRDGDGPWNTSAEHLMVAVITDADVVAGNHTLAYSPARGDDVELLRFYSRCSTIRVGIDIVPIPRIAGSR